MEYRENIDFLTYYKVVLNISFLQYKRAAVLVQPSLFDVAPA